MNNTLLIQSSKIGDTFFVGPIPTTPIGRPVHSLPVNELAMSIMTGSRLLLPPEEAAAV